MADHCVTVFLPPKYCANAACGNFLGALKLRPSDDDGELCAACQRAEDSASGATP